MMLQSNRIGSDGITGCNSRAVIVGAVVAIIYGCQLNEMHKSTVAATNAAKAAKDSVTFARQSAHLDQRAWVATDGFIGKPELNDRYIITALVKNTGKTFAQRCSGTIKFRVKQLSDPDPNFEKIVQEEPDEIIGLIAPGQTFSMPVQVNSGEKVTKEQMALMDNPTVVVLTFGKITYWDIFGCKHWTTFCYRAFTRGPPFEAYSQYNDADENYCP